MKNNKKKTIKKKIKGGAPTAAPTAATKTHSIQIEGLDLSFIHKLGSAGAKLIAGGIVFGVEQMFAAIASRSPKPLSKDTIHDYKRCSKLKRYIDVMKVSDNMIINHNPLSGSRNIFDGLI